MYRRRYIFASLRGIEQNKRFVKGNFNESVKKVRFNHKYLVGWGCGRLPRPYTSRLEERSMPTPQEPLYPDKLELNTKICVYKTCAFKGEPQPLENFHRRKNGRYGRNWWCKVCISAYRKLHPDAPYVPDENTPASKVCTRKTCPFKGISQSLDNFYPAKSGKFGRSSWCKTCSLLNLKRPPRQRRVLRPAPEGFKICCTKTCSHNGKAQLISNFAKSKRRIDGLHHTCKDCVKESSLKRKRLNIEKFSDRSILFAEGKTKVCSRATVFMVARNSR